MADAIQQQGFAEHDCFDADEQEIRGYRDALKLIHAAGSFSQRREVLRLAHLSISACSRKTLSRCGDLGEARGKQELFTKQSSIA